MKKVWFGVIGIFLIILLISLILISGYLQKFQSQNSKTEKAIAVCNLISNNDLKNNCINMARLNCKAVNDFLLKDECYYMLARTSGEDSFCEKMGGNKNFCYFEIAKMTVLR